jgi:hypothetical protein
MMLLAASSLNNLGPAIGGKKVRSVVRAFRHYGASYGLLLSMIINARLLPLFLYKQALTTAGYQCGYLSNVLL